MTIRKLSAGRGAGWITDGIAVFKSNPGTYLTACVVVGLLSSLPVFGLFFGLLMPVMYGGLLSVLQHQARGEQTAVGQIFDGFQQPGAFARLLPIVLINLAIAFVIVIIVFVTIGVAVFQLIRESQAHQQPDPQMVMALLPKFALLLLFLLPIGVLFGWVMLLAIPRAMLGQVPGMTALREALSAVASNFLPLLVNLFDPGPTATRLRSRAMPGEDPTTLPQPSDVAPALASLCLPSEQRHASLVRYDPSATVPVSGTFRQ